jgi:hypothetical protein
MKLFNIPQELSNLIWFRFAAAVLQIQRSRRRGMLKNMVTATNPVQAITESLRETTDVAEANVVLTGEDLEQELSTLQWKAVCSLLGRR